MPPVPVLLLLDVPPVPAPPVPLPIPPVPAAPLGAPAAKARLLDTANAAASINVLIFMILYSPFVSSTAYDARSLRRSCKSANLEARKSPYQQKACEGDSSATSCASIG